MRPSHEQFVNAYRNGEIRVHIDPRGAAKFMSARLLLPLVALPVLGIGTALALAVSFWAGLIVIAIGTLGPLLIKRSAPHFVMTQSLQDAQFYDDAIAAGVLEVIAS